MASGRWVVIRKKRNVGSKLQKEQEGADAASVVKYSTDWDKSALLVNFEKRGWKQVQPDDGQWNFYWAGTQTCRYIFGVDRPYRMGPNQMINHFPNSMELSRKDLLVKNIKRLRKDLERKGDPLAAMYPNNHKLGVGGTRYIHLDIIPMTFVLPTEYSLFTLEFQKNPRSTWIVKPCGKSQGTGIFLINKLSKVKKYASEPRTYFVSNFNRETCVISKYIENPLLIGGKKFDLRLYVLVTMFTPMKAYLYNEGFCRFCTEKYNETDLDNLFMHLTNVSIQKTNKEYNAIHGGKWPIQNLWLFLDSTRGDGVSEKLKTTIQRTIRISLDAVAPAMANDRHCFEVYGFDIIIDSKLKPWLIEINSSPSLHSTTINDRQLKSRLIDNVLSVIMPPTGIPDIHWDKTPDESLLTNFTVLLPLQPPVIEQQPPPEEPTVRTKTRRKLKSKKTTTTTTVDQQLPQQPTTTKKMMMNNNAANSANATATTTQHTTSRSYVKCKSPLPQSKFRQK